MLISIKARVWPVLILLLMGIFIQVATGFAQEGKKVIEVDVSGLKNVALKTVWDVTKTRKGQDYKQTVIDEDLRKMFDLNLFASINVDVSDVEDGVKVTFIVVEKPLIKQIDFKGNSAIKVSALKDEVTIKEKQAVDQTKLDESRNKIITYYKDKGFADIKVETYTTDVADGKQILTFFITEGNKIKIGEVLVSGNSFFQTKKIQKVMKTRKGKVYKEETLNKDVDELNKFYKERGFYNFKMNDPEISYNPEHTKMTVKVTLSEGLRYKITAIKYTGNKVVTIEEILKDMPVREGRFYNQDDFNQGIANIQALYADKGYVYARVNPVVTTHDDTQTMDIDYQVTEGPLAHVGEIEVAGNEITKDYVIEREILLHKGDPLSMTRVKRSQEQLYNLGFFEDVGLETKPNQEKPEEQMDLIFNVKEKSQVNVLSLGMGYSSVDKLVGNIQLQINNLLGRGQQVNLMYETGALRQNYTIGFADPWFLQSYYSFGAQIFDTRHDKNYYWTNTVQRDDNFAPVHDANGQTITLPDSEQTQQIDVYDETDRGGSIRFGRRFGEIYNAGLGYSYESTLISNLTERDKVSDEIRSVVDRGLVETSALTLTLARDTRDNVFDTTTGSHHTLTYKVAGGMLQGDNSYQKLVLETAWFFPSFWKFVWGLHGMAGEVNRYGKSPDVPIYERFYLGGAETLRGYEYNGQVGEVGGGKFTTLFNLEYAFPIIREKRQTILKGAFFYDAGNTWSTTKLGHDEYALKTDVGFGLRFAIPMFPIRFDWGYGLNHREGEAKSQFFFSIGPVF